LFALFLDATGGFFVLIIFLSALVLSSIFHIIALKSFSCDISVNTALAEKGENILLTARFPRAPFFLPTVFEITLNLSYHLECSEKTYSITLNRRENQHTFALKAVFWGNTSVCVASVKAVDILGIYSPFFGRYLKSRSNRSLPVKIFPSIPDLSKNSELLRTLEDASAYDDNEQSREVPYAITGFPGYEHRDYFPGDSLKSINWKLSAKRDRLLTRKPEAYAGGDQVLILDTKASSHHDNITARTREQLALESMLSLALILTKQEILCRAYVKFADGWGFAALAGVGDIEKLRYALTEYSYITESADRLADLTNEKASGFVIFTANPDSALYSAAEVLRQKGINPEIASPVAGYANNWRIEEVSSEIVFMRD
jgi:hypothetical protein